MQEMDDFDQFDDEEADDMGEMVDDIRYSQLRCEWCDARMFDTTGLISQRDDEHVEVKVKCYRCRHINRVYLAPGDTAAMAVIGDNI
jgi:phage FluMu protein Com